MRDFIAPVVAAGMIFGGGMFLYLTLGSEGQRVDAVHLAVTTFMGGAIQYLFGADIQKRAIDGQPTITTTSGPPATTTVTSDPRASYDGDPYENVR